jgi:hypothetical protein
MCGLKSICDFRSAIYPRIGASRVNHKSQIVNVADIALKKETACILPEQRAGG